MQKVSQWQELKCKKGHLAQWNYYSNYIYRHSLSVNLKQNATNSAVLWQRHLI